LIDGTYLFVDFFDISAITSKFENCWDDSTTFAMFVFVSGAFSENKKSIRDGKIAAGLIIFTYKNKVFIKNNFFYLPVSEVPYL